MFEAFFHWAPGARNHHQAVAAGSFFPWNVLHVKLLNGPVEVLSASSSVRAFLFRNGQVIMASHVGVLSIAEGPTES